MQARRNGASTTEADRINYADRTLMSIINDILDVSKIEAGRMDVGLDRRPRGFG